jgi:hypothetical protein
LQGLVKGRHTVVFEKIIHTLLGFLCQTFRIVAPSCIRAVDEDIRNELRFSA